MSAIYDVKNFQPSTSVGYLLNRVRSALLATLDDELAAFDVTGAQYAIMAHLAFGMADSPSQICQVISYDPGAMTRMVDRLEAKGLIRRVPHPQDRRALNLELTEEGRSTFPKLLERVVGVLNRFLRGFTKSEVRQLSDLLQRMLSNAEGKP